jgi:hypothetical protein
MHVTESAFDPFRECKGLMKKTFLLPNADCITCVLTLSPKYVLYLEENDHIGLCRAFLAIRLLNLTMLDRTPLMVSTSLFWMISIPFLLIFIMYLQFIFRKYLVLSRGMHMYT